MKLQPALLKAVPLLLLIGGMALSVTTSQEPPWSIEDIDNYGDSINIRHKLHKHPLPLKIFGFRPGYATDRQMAKNLGSGLYDKEGGHIGSRFYDYPGRGIQVYYSIGVDNIVDYISVTSAAYPFGYFEGNKANNRDRIPGWANLKLTGGISLGSSPEKLKACYGVPNYDYKEDSVRIIIYMDGTEEWKEVAHYEATFSYIGDKLVRMSIYNGE